VFQMHDIPMQKNMKKMIFTCLKKSKAIWKRKKKFIFEIKLHHVFIFSIFKLAIKGGQF
jgi:hypothetical protein